MKEISVFIPDDELERINSVNHHKQDEWVKLIYYEKRKEKMVFPDEVVNYYKSCDIYKKNCFYKVCSLSNKDHTWDYYRKLKNDISKKKNIGIEDNTNKKKEIKKKPKFEIKHFPNGYKLKFD